MKNNKELIGEIIKDIRRDMSDEEILSLLANSKIAENTDKEAKKSLHRRATRGRHDSQVCRQLGVYIFIRGGAAGVDGRQHYNGGKRV